MFSKNKSDRSYVFYEDSKILWIHLVIGIKSLLVSSGPYHIDLSVKYVSKW